MKNLHELTDLQLAIMREIWTRGTATVTDVHQSLSKATGLAKKTIGTLMTRLEQQGFLVHYADGREFVYEPTVTRREVGRAKMKNVLDALFGGSLPALVSHALEAKDIESGDVEKIRTLIAEWEKKGRKGRREQP